MAAWRPELYAAPVSGWPLRPFEPPATSSQCLHRGEIVARVLLASPTLGTVEAGQSVQAGVDMDGFQCS